MLTERIARHQAMVAILDKELDARKLGIALTPEERLAVFGSTRLEDNAGRAERQWGDSDSGGNGSGAPSPYSEQEWLEIRSEQAGIHQRLLDAMRAGTPPADPAAWTSPNSTGSTWTGGSTTATTTSTAPSPRVPRQRADSAATTTTWPPACPATSTTPSSQRRTSGGVLHALVTCSWVAWSAVWVMMRSHSLGVKRPRASCRRRRR